MMVMDHIVPVLRLILKLKAVLIKFFVEDTEMVVLINAVCLIDHIMRRVFSIMRGWV